MEDYLKILLEQIRCKKARPGIEWEIKSHIEEQAKANRTEWMMGEEEAMEQAVRDMGNPVEVGALLDKIHRPKMAWDFVLVMALIAVASLAVHIAIGTGAAEVGSQTGEAYLFHAALYTGIGFLAMLLVYRLDYSILAGRGRLFAGIFLAFITMEICFMGTTVNGSRAFLFMNFPDFQVSLPHLMFLYIPLFGAVLHQHYGSGWKGVFKTLPFLLYPVFLVMKMPRMGFAALLLLIMSVMLTVAVADGWFLIPKKRFLGIYWGLLAILPVGLVFLTVNGAFAVPMYQKARLEAMIGGGYVEYDYVTGIVMECLKNSRLFGAGKAAAPGYLPDYYRDYILTFLSSCYGIAAACGICLLVGVIGIKAFRISFGQGSRLGMMMGCSCGLVFLFNLIFHAAENTGIFLLPKTETFLPFFSYTGTGIIVSYILAGIVMSVYRYKDILPSDSKRMQGKRRCAQN